MASAGLRRGALPYLRIRDLQKIDKYQLYKIAVYKNEQEYYAAFCTPECAKYIDQYLDWRQRLGEKLHESTPLLRKSFDTVTEVNRPKPISHYIISTMITSLLDKTGVRVANEVNQRTELMQCHGFRKFFKTICINAGMNPLYSEYLMGHRSGLTKSYFKPSDMELLEGNDKALGYTAVINDLTINEEYRLRKRIDELAKKKDEIEIMEIKHSEEIKTMRDQMNQIMIMIRQKKYPQQKGTAGFIELELNHKYDKKTIVSDVYDDNWNKTIKQFKERAKQKGISKEHTDLLTDLMDDYAGKIIAMFGVSRKEARIEDLFLDRAKEQIVAVALEFIEKQTVKLFLNQVNTPYIAIKVKNHTETMPLESWTFGDWLAASFYNHLKEGAKKEVHEGAERSLMMAVRVLSAENIKNIQTILRFEADKTGDTITLNSRVASFINEQDSSESRIWYDLCNKDWEIVRITANEWSIERNYPQILFKRHAVNKAQVLPNKDYPKDKNYLEAFMKLTNVYDDHDSKLIASVYVVALFLLADLPKPVMMPHGTHGSGKSTFQEFIKQVVDPSGAPTTAFPNSLAELIQELDHSYLTFFDNVSEISALTSDTLCRVVTGSGLIRDSYTVTTKTLSII